MTNEVKQTTLDLGRSKVSVNTSNINELLSQLTLLSTPEAIHQIMVEVEEQINELSDNVVAIESLLTKY